MTTIETEKKTSPNSIESLFGFLSDLNNLEKLMPVDKRIGLKKEGEEAPNKIMISSFGKVPFTFNLDILLEQQDAEQTKAQMIFKGDINPFMKMMVEKPLRNFFNMLIDKAAELKL